jgi:cytochrome P450
VPKGGLYIPAFADHIPEGGIVGISHIFIHDNPEIFEDPKTFKPERWMGDKGKELNHWLLAFSKGSRDCIGKK